MKTVICTEKPSVAIQICKTLHVDVAMDGYMESDEYIVTWCLGHLIRLSYPESYNPELKKWSLEALPFFPDKFFYEIIPTKRVEKQFKVIREIYNRPDVGTILYCPDPAREGIYIQYLVRQEAGVNEGVEEKVIWINSQTESEILRGIREAKPLSEYEDLAAAGKMRAIEDYVTGINFTRALTTKYGYKILHTAGLDKGSISVGRVMSCVLGMIAMREREIANFKPTPFYKLVAKKGEVVFEWKAKEPSKYKDSPLLYDESGFLAKGSAEGLKGELQEKNFTISDIKTTHSTKQAPLLFNLAELQAESAKVFHISPDETLATIQKLYDKRLLSYPRTDARVLSTAIAKEIDTNLAGISKLPEYSQIVSIINKYGTAKNIANTKYTNDEKIEDHYAIIPTGEISGYKELEGLEKEMYDFVVRRFLAIFLPPAEYDTLEIKAMCDGEPFQSKKKCLVKRGYLSLYKGNEKQEIKANVFQKGESFIPDSIEVKEGSTQAPKRYTSGSIILAMENAGKLIEDEELREQIKSSGIGTSATRADIIQKLEKNKYISCNAKTQVLTPTNLGQIIFDTLLLTIPEILSPEMTASWEKGLEYVAKGTVTKEKFLKTLRTDIEKKIKTIKENDITNILLDKIKPYAGKSKLKEAHEISANCPYCGKPMRCTSTGSYVCSGWTKENPTCNFFMQPRVSKNGPKLTEKQVIEGLTTGRINGIKGFKSKNGNTFTADVILKKAVVNDRRFVNFVFDFPEKQEAGEDRETDILCPVCKEKKLLLNNLCYHCSTKHVSSYLPRGKKKSIEMEFKIPLMLNGHKLTEAEVKQICEDGKTKARLNFYSERKKRNFDARLVWDSSTNSISFSFDKS